MGLPVGGIFCVDPGAQLNKLDTFVILHEPTVMIGKPCPVPPAAAQPEEGRAPASRPSSRKRRSTRITAESLASLVAELARESGVIETGKLMIQAFETQVLAATKPVPHSGLSVAVLRGMVAREEIKQEEGGSLSAAEAAQRLRISKTAILNRYHAGRVLGWKEARQGAVRMPVWQFQDDNLLPGLVEILGILNQASWMDDWGRISFFLNRRGSLGNQRPLDLLRNGDLERAKQAAWEAVQ